MISRKEKEKNISATHNNIFSWTFLSCLMFFYFFSEIVCSLASGGLKCIKMKQSSKTISLFWTTPNSNSEVKSAFCTFKYVLRSQNSREPMV